jgi:hypothetical protein
MNTFLSSVANWQEFRSQNTKVALQKFQRPNKSEAELKKKNLSKNGRKEAELFKKLVLHTKGKIFTETYILFHSHICSTFFLLLCGRHLLKMATKPACM